MEISIILVYNNTADVGSQSILSGIVLTSKSLAMSVAIPSTLPAADEVRLLCLLASASRDVEAALPFFTDIFVSFTSFDVRQPRLDDGWSSSLRQIGLSLDDPGLVWGAMPGAELARRLSIRGTARVFESRDDRPELFGIGAGLVDDSRRFPTSARGDPDLGDCCASSLVLGSRVLLGLLDGVLLFSFELSSSGDVGFESFNEPETGGSNPESFLLDDPVLEMDLVPPTDDLLAWEHCNRTAGGIREVIPTSDTTFLFTTVPVDRLSLPLVTSASRRSAEAGLEAPVADRRPDLGRRGSESTIVEDISIE